ncbi:5-methyltetrahydropteroyltriglutamate--homocysteine S-methyltransferase [Paenibacillus sp. DMB20]|uniref:5-methyltetrahydropteroyltriglutamate-- homocysteine S-methyltransferase n=1 Tax=Paenibacillus sp. DMB20 TaxID=1642570 RepID=UPI0006275D24|nr:5-methyltetrahydropteroyltriglutamate--homocysteine S-methyltransferase [Paenibacillus sp. DMB20]KKO53381.1 5-methyltetrahydropteroyltriglutamate--homocysteine methyltransferase [Paenibacillus sp. DMB20]
MNHIQSGNLGYPRIGENREWKKALEAHWAGKLEEAELLEQMKLIRLSHLRTQKEKGIDWIPVNDFTLYDHVLDTAFMFGLIPERFKSGGNGASLSTYFAMARGSKTASACEMTKWFNTNYHYIVPELGEGEPVLTVNRPLEAYREAKREAGIEAKPVIVGPYTFVKLSKGYDAGNVDRILDRLLPLYVQVLQELQAEGVQWLQLDEPSLVATMTEDEMARVERIYSVLHEQAPELNIMLQTYFDSVEFYDRVVSLPVQGVGLDFVHGLEGNLAGLQQHGFPQDKVLGAGVIDGRGIWRADLNRQLDLIERLTAYVPQDRIVVQPSSSLLHVPVTVASEHKLDPVLHDALAFAAEKLNEVKWLQRAVIEGKNAVRQEFEAASLAVSRLNQSPQRSRQQVQDRMAKLDQEPSKRISPFAERSKKQQEKWRLPLLPTTTIGSFPQTAEVRKARQLWRKGEWSPERYREFIREEIGKWIAIQENIGLDVLVHGEFERTDMVEFFGEKLGGFAFTSHGWVQSYGSRCVKPPVIFGDVEFLAPMTTEETVYAQSLTGKPVKGMLTGPLTILNWSFVRDDISRESAAFQIAFALREEVEALEAAGIEMIQVDEPALREGLPLKKDRHARYLEQAVLAFKLATSTIRDTTQIHTHMCYCEFHDIIDSIRALDADVISIETSRSHGELISHFEDHTYDLGIGLGMYDIHSPRVPSVEEMVSMMDRALSVLDPQLFWINPDCGLKTRGLEETVASLENMVKAAKIYREKCAVVAKN